MNDKNASTSTRAACPHCQHISPRDTPRLQQLLEKTSLTCKKCNGDMVLASEEQLKRFEKFGSAGIAFMLVMVTSALTVVIAIVLKWLGGYSWGHPDDDIPHRHSSWSSLFVTCKVCQ